MSHQQPALFVPHGVPTFALAPGAAGAALAQAAARLPRPRAVVVVSPHWDTELPAVGFAEAPATIHDYWGFPAPLYDIRYPAPGDPALAEAVCRRLEAAGFPVRRDAARGLDHGAWIPLRTLYPAADVPVVPLSIQSHLGPLHHYRLGETLAPLLDEGILLLATGNITHNLRDFQTAASRGTGTPDYVPRFADWLWARIEAGDSAAVLGYRELGPDAVRAHPGEDHILPLHFALGAAGSSYRAERLHAGVDSLVLAMDAYVFRRG